MRLLIIGSEGFIGRNAVSYFLSKDWEVTGCDIVYTPSGNNYPYIKLDAFSLDYTSTFNQSSYDFCLNAAGSANVGFSFENPELDFNSNVYAVHKMLNAIRLYNPGCKLVNLSSAAVYGNSDQIPIREDTRLQPLSPYGWHKLMAENLCKEYNQLYNVNNCNLRIFSAYGPHLKKQLFWDLYYKAKADTSLMFGTGEETRDFIFIEDILQVIELIVQKGEFCAEVYNVANGQEQRVRTAAELFYARFKPRQKVIFNQQVRLGDPVRWQADIAKIKGLGYQQTVSFEEGITQYVAWLQNDLK